MTYSITGRCARTGDVGLALATFSFLFGPMQDADLRPAWWLAHRDAGAITCQAETRMGFAMKVAERLRAGERATGALQAAMADEPQGSFFQVAVVDSGGCAAAFTGGSTADWKGHLTGDGWAAAGNILASEHVVTSMARTFEERADLELPERLLAALAAGRNEGGDRRGTRNAIVKVASANVMGGLAFQIWEHEDPIGELSRLVALARPEHEFLTLVHQTARRFVELLPGSGLDLAALQPLSIRQAAPRVRRAWTEHPQVTPADLGLADRFLSALDDRPDWADMSFQQVLSFLPLLAS